MRIVNLRVCQEEKAVNEILLPSKVIAVGDTVMDCLIECRARDFWSVSRGRKQRSRGKLIGVARVGICWKRVSIKRRASV